MSTETTATRNEMIDTIAHQLTHLSPAALERVLVVCGEDMVNRTEPVRLNYEAESALFALRKAAAWLVANRCVVADRAVVTRRLYHSLVLHVFGEAGVAATASPPSKVFVYTVAGPVEVTAGPTAADVTLYAGDGVVAGVSCPDAC